MGNLHRAARCALVVPVIAVVAACGTTVPQTTTLGGARAAGTVAQGGSVTAASGDAGATADGAPVADASAAATPGGAPVAAGGSTTAGSLGVPAPGTTSAPVAAASATPGVSTTRRTTTGTTAAASAKAGATKGPGTTASRAPGATSVGGVSTAPLKIGLSYIDESSNASVNAAAGAATSNTISVKQVAEGMRDYYNAHGGLDGRQISLVEVPESSMATSFDSDASAACQTFTQDQPVPIVIDLAYGSGSGFAGCLQKAGVEDLDIGGPPDARTLAALPYVSAPQVMTPDRNYVAPLTQLAASGYLKSSNKIGIFMDTCSATEAAYANAVAPAIKRLGLTAVTPFTSSCINGYGGLGTASTDAASAVLNFRSNGVDRVMVLSQGVDQTYWLLFAEAANSQGYTPGFIMASTGEPTVLEPNLPAAQRPAIHGAGYIPAVDADNQKFPQTAAEAACDKMAAAQGATPSGYEDYFLISVVCSPFQVLQAAFQADGANAGAAVLSKAIAGLGTSLQDPGILGGVGDFSTQDAPVNAQVFGWNASCSCVQYSGSPSPA